MIDFESRSAHALLALARQRNGIYSASCARAFAHLHAAERLRRGLRRVLARHQLTDLQFALLVLLLASEADPIPMAVLARDAGVSRTAVTDAFDTLEAAGLALRIRDGRDRRIIYGQITAFGRAKINQSVDDYLRAVVCSQS